MTRGNAVVFGAGAVGRGVVAELLRGAGLTPVMVTPGAGSGRTLSEQPVRMVTTSAYGCRDVVLPPMTWAPAEDASRVAELVRHAALVVVATGPGHEAEVALALAAGLRRRASTVDVLVCDNRRDGAERLRAVAAQHWAGAGTHGFAGMLVDRIVNRAAAADGSVQLRGEATGRLYVDARALRAPLPSGTGFELVEDFEAYAVRKLHVLGAGHAAAAYLGRLRGHTHLHDALVDPVVRRVTRAAMVEGRAGVVRRYGGWFAGRAALVDQHLDRFADPLLGDTVARVGRNPRATLAPADRIFGPALLAQQHGVATPALTVVAAAALLAADDDLSTSDGRRDSGRTTSDRPAAYRELLQKAASTARWLERGLSPSRALDLLTVAATRASAGAASGGAGWPEQREEAS